jgi:hypothetical protein
MAQLNSISPTRFTTGFVITDTNDDGTIPIAFTPGAALDIQSTLGALVVPRMTTTQVTAIGTIPNGSILYNTTLNQMLIYEGGAPTPLNPIPVLTNDTDTIFMGFSVGNLTALTSASHNILFGIAVGPSITTGSDNVGVGDDVFGNLTSGSSNVGMGVGALSAIVASSGSVGIGLDALTNGTSLTNCTAVGLQAGETQTTLTNCTFLGANSEASTNDLTNATAIGAGAVVGTSNAIVLGLVGSTNVGIGTSNPTSTLHLVSSSNAINIEGAMIGKVVRNSGSTYNVAINDFLVAQTAAAGTISIVLPAITLNNVGVMYKIKNQSSGTGPINITATGGVNIDASATLAITTAYGHFTVYNDGSQWYTI